MAAVKVCPECQGSRRSPTSRQDCWTCRGTGTVPSTPEASGEPSGTSGAGGESPAASSGVVTTTTTPTPTPTPTPTVELGPHAQLVAALVRAQTSAPVLVVSGRKDDRYDYATEADYHATMRDVLAREGLALTTEQLLLEPVEEVPQKSGSPIPARRTVRLRVRISHVEGGHLVVESAGTGTDTEGGVAAGDKAVSKALTAAWKALWAHLFWYRRDGDLTAEVALRARVAEVLPAAMAEAWMVLVMGWPDLATLAAEPQRVPDLLDELRRRAPEIRAWAAAQRGPKK